MGRTLPARLGLGGPSRIVLEAGLPVLPLIDLLILIAWSSLAWAFVHKGLWLAFASSFTIFGLTPYDFVLGAGICLLFALALAARVWVKSYEPPALRGAHRPPHENEVLPDAPDPRLSVADAEPAPEHDDRTATGVG